MSRETTDTRFKITKEGTWNMTSVKPCIKKLTKSETPRPYYEFEFEYKEGNITETHKEILFPSQASTLLRALKCQETEPGVFDWDKNEIVGRKIKATIAHIQDKKDASKKRAVIVSAEPIEVEEVPF